MAKPTEVKILLTVDGDAAKELKGTIKSMQNFNETTKKTAKESSEALKVLQGVLGAQAILGSVKALATAAKKLFQTFVNEGVKAAQVQEDALNQLSTAMKLSGDYSKEAFDDMTKFASGMQKTTKIGDETTLQMLALAKSFGKGNEETKKLVEASIELSAASSGTMSLESAVKNLGKTYAGMTGELGESFPAIRSLTAEQLKSGDALELVINRFGGSARAQIKTFSGAIGQSSNAFGDLQEKVGMLITSNPAVIKAINEFATLFDELGNTINTNKNFLSEVVKTFVQVGLTIAEVSSVAINESIILWKRFTQAVVYAESSIASAAGAIAKVFGKETLGRAFELAAEGSAARFTELNAEIAELQKSDSFFNKLSNRLGEINANVGETTSKLNSVGTTDNGIGNGPKLDDSVQLMNEKQELINKEVDMLLAKNAMFASIEGDAAKEQIEINNKKLEEIQRSYDASLDTTLKIEKSFTEKKKKQEQEREQAVSSTLGRVSTLQNSQVKELAALGKAAAIAQAIRDTYAGATLAFAQLGAFGFPAAALITAAGLANVAKIAGVPGLKDGMTSVPGSGYQDNYPAILAPGERVVDRGTNEDLKSFLASNQSQNQILTLIADKLSNMDKNVIVQVGSKTITDVIRDEMKSGRFVA